MIGEIAALSAACLWALASLIYARLGQGRSGLALNLGKGVIALALLAITLVSKGLIMPPITAQTGSLLLISGALGIGLGDSLYLEALRSLGARRTLLLGTLAPGMSSGLALLFLQETLSGRAGWGMAITLIGIVWVISERVPLLEQEGDQRVSVSGKGISLAIWAAVAQAIGAVLSRAALANTPVSPEWAAFLRLMAGVTVLLVWGAIHAQLQD
ncbi:MAG: DMT family transporter, partial [Acaryochloridaceae cyanobacterium CSU_5_19]|nr:DMT family transporter [Acaryochloridaceae cyanobacterium CSU_5_19]